MICKGLKYIPYDHVTTFETYNYQTTEIDRLLLQIIKASVTDFNSENRELRGSAKALSLHERHYSVQH